MFKSGFRDTFGEAEFSTVVSVFCFFIIIIFFYFCFVPRKVILFL